MAAQQLQTRCEANGLYRDDDGLLTSQRAAFDIVD